MKSEQQNWITGPRFGEERRRLIEAGVPETDSRFQTLMRQVLERDDTLYEQFGKPLLEQFPGKWVAISLEGEVIITNTSGEAIWAAAEKFGPGNAAIRKLAEFPGLVFHR